MPKGLILVFAFTFILTVFSGCMEMPIIKKLPSQDQKQEEIKK